MITSEIANRLKQVFSIYTTDFNDVINISSLSKLGNTITATTSTNHNLANNSYITIKGAKKPIANLSITYNGNIATATATASHNLIDPSKYGFNYLPILITIVSANPNYTGTFELISVENDLVFKFKLLTTPNTTATGILYIDDFDGYNGYKQIQVVNSTTFTYQSTAILQSPPVGTITATTGTRVDTSATIERITEDYLGETPNNLNNNWLYVVALGCETYKNDTTTQDITASINKNSNYYYILKQDFCIVAVLPSKTSRLGGIFADTCRNLYRKYIIKAIAGYPFTSSLLDKKYQPAVFLGDDTLAYVGGYYMHSYEFTTKVVIQNEDTAELNKGVPLEKITNQNSNINYVVDL
jgi:hypothetical protein